MLLTDVIEAILRDRDLSENKLAIETKIGRKPIRGLRGVDGKVTDMPTDETLLKLCLFLSSLSPPLIYKGKAITNGNLSLNPGDPLVFESYSDLRQLHLASKSDGPNRQTLLALASRVPAEEVTEACLLLASLTEADDFYLNELLQVNEGFRGGRDELISHLSEGNILLANQIRIDIQRIGNGRRPSRTSMISFARMLLAPDKTGFGNDVQKLEAWLQTRARQRNDRLPDFQREESGMTSR